MVLKQRRQSEVVFQQGRRGHFLKLSGSRGIWKFKVLESISTLRFRALLFFSLEALLEPRLDELITQSSLKFCCSHHQVISLVFKLVIDQAFRNEGFYFIYLLIYLFIYFMRAFKTLPVRPSIIHMSFQFVFDLLEPVMFIFEAMSNSHPIAAESF